MPCGKPWNRGPDGGGHAAKMNRLSPFAFLAQVQMPRFPPLDAAWSENLWRVGLAYLALVAVGLGLDVVLGWWLIRHPHSWFLHVRRLQWRPWTRRAAGALVVLLLALYLVSAAMQPLVRACSAWWSVNEQKLWIIVHSVTFHLAGLAIVVGLLVRRRMTWKCAFGFDRRAFWRHVGLGVLFYVSALPFLVFYALLYRAVLQYLGHPIQPQLVPVIFTGEESVWLRVYLAVLACVVAPVFEEILFRGIALPLLAQKWGVAPAIVVVSLGFALIHFHAPSVLPLFVIAVAFSLGYIYSDSILVPMVMHGVFNAVNLGLLTLLRGSWL